MNSLRQRVQRFMMLVCIVPLLTAQIGMPQTAPAISENEWQLTPGAGRDEMLPQDSYIAIAGLQNVAASGANHYVSPIGSSNGSGSQSSPWDLKTALNHPSSVGPGDIIWLQSGTYKGDFSSKLTGAPGNPIIVRALPGEGARIDGSIAVKGAWSTFWGLEVMSSYPDRVKNSSSEDMVRKAGFLVVAPQVQLINNVIHDTKQGISAWDEAVDLYAYGNIIFNNGYEGSDRGHGHGIYAQNAIDTKVLENNIVFSNFGGYGIHIYAEKGNLIGFDLLGNVVFNGDVLIGGATAADNITVRDNYTYRSKSKFYWKSKSNKDLALTGNYLVGTNGLGLEVGYWEDLTVSGNFIYSDSGDLVRFYYPSSVGQYYWNENRYSYAGSGSKPFRIDSTSSQNYSGWRQVTGFDSASVFSGSAPSENLVDIRVNKYEQNRAHIVVFNWEMKDTIELDLTSLGLDVGDSYIVRFTQDYYNYVIGGKYDGGPASIPWTAASVAKPIGYSVPLGPSTLPEFGALVIEVGITFLDVPPLFWAHDYIEAIHDAGYTAGCSEVPPLFCVDNPASRAEMAVFLLKVRNGSGYEPPPPSGGVFPDIAGHWAQAWIEQLAKEGITSGYPDGTYRPQSPVTRAEMAVLLLKAIHVDVPPPPQGGIFSDIGGNWAQAWIEQLYREGITSGYPDGTYRPGNQVTRAEMAVFLVRAGDLPLTPAS